MKCIATLIKIDDYGRYHFIIDEDINSIISQLNKYEGDKPLFDNHGYKGIIARPKTKSQNIPHIGSRLHLKLKIIKYQIKGKKGVRLQILNIDATKIL